MAQVHLIVPNWRTLDQKGVSDKLQLGSILNPFNLAVLNL